MSGEYRHLAPLDASAGGYSIRCIAAADIEDIRCWRNAQMEVLRQASPISASEQSRYFNRAVWPEMDRAHPETILVTIVKDAERIGYGGLVHCDWEHRRAEISVLFNPSVAADQPEYRRALMAFLAMIREVGFARLGFNRLTLETYDLRSFHVGVLEEAGFHLEGRLREHVMIDGKPVDSLIHAALVGDQDPAGGRTTSCATRSIRVPAGGAV